MCPYCGVGCGIVMDVENDRVVKVSGDKQHPSNFGRLCTKGSTCHLPIADSGRMEHAYLRRVRGGDPLPVALDEAISETANRLRDILDEHGADAIALYVSGQMSLEAQYLANKLAKGFIGTNNIESNSRLCMASAGTGYKLSLGSDGPPGGYDDFDHADLFFVSGANMADCHPILYLRMMDRVKTGARLIVVDPRRTATADKADLYLPIRPGTDLALLNGLLHLLLENGHCDEDFIARHTEGWEAMPAFLADYTPAKVAALTGLDKSAIRQAAQWIGEAGEWMSCWTMGLNQSTHGTWNTNALCNLHLATGKICRTGSGPFSLTGQPNAMGGREMGYMGPGLPGQRSVLNETDRAFVEAAWKIPAGTLHTRLGKGTVAMFENMRAGLIKACWIICTNPVASVSNRATVIEALQTAELVIAQDAYLDTETNRHADVLLPAALWAEADGVMINSERNMTLAPQAVAPPGEALADWQLIARVATAMGFHGFEYASAAEVFEEIKGFWNPVTGYDIRGVSHSRLREAPVQWPSAPGDESVRHPIRYLNSGTSQLLRLEENGATPTLNFATASGKAQFFPRPHMDAKELPDTDFPFLLNTGRLQHQWHTLTKTGKIATLNKLNPKPFIEVHPQDANALNVKTGEYLEVRSRRGRAVLPVQVSDRVQPGNAFAPFHWNDLYGENLAINAITSDAVDPLSQQPELKVCAISLMKVELLEHQFLPTTIPQEAIATTPLHALATTLDIADEPRPVLTAAERTWMAGFIDGAHARQLPGIPTLPATAPIEPATRLWLDGLLAGLYAEAIPLKDDAPSIAVLWASQTGNAEGLAERLVTHLGAAGLNAQSHCMADYPVERLVNAGTVLLLSSTFGDGDAPDNGQAFWESLSASACRLDGLRYAVLALGDSSYDEFCRHGGNLHAAFAERGAAPLLDCQRCDGDFEGPAQGWFERLTAVLDPSITRSAKPLATGVDSPKKGISKERPFASRLVGNLRLNAKGSLKDTRAFALHLDGTALTYEAGDALGIWPRNCPDLVDEILQNGRLDGERCVNVPKVGDVSLREALSRHYEIARPSTDSLALIAERSGNEELRARLSDAVGLKDWLWGRQLADVLHTYPTELDANTLLASLKPLQPRLYSISSSAKAYADQVHLTVSAVRYGARKGVASTFLADRAEFDPVSIFVQPTRDFRPPEGDTPVIMIGPGTGVAPFRAFLQERRARGDTGRNWLFFGEQHEASDFYYRDELLGFHHDGLLTHLSLAFSRDQTHKLYVQDRIREQGNELWRWLDAGAHLYVCGDATRMAKDVDKALREAISLHAGVDETRAAEYLRTMAQQKRYVRDVY
ncbi:bifunctional reductase [Pseudomonas matsuisoli]|uniref:assimilatory sulfite reductase (NADPH) n=1 Tax=Pseudomonas matsuisoli TaxID=1515666 RepID=A0A917PHQ8_9PSED|nr:bifunctional reductase [Pseudomonas matsuisoli]